MSAAGQVQLARDTGALMHLTFAPNLLARTHILAGELAAATRLVEEDHLMADAVGHLPIANTAMMLAAWRGQEQEASELIEAISREATAHAAPALGGRADYASAVPYNGLGRSAAGCARSPATAGSSPPGRPPSKSSTSRSATWRNSAVATWESAAPAVTIKD